MCDLLHKSCGVLCGVAAPGDGGGGEGGGPHLVWGARGKAGKVMQATRNAMYLVKVCAYKLKFDSAAASGQ